MAERKPEKKKGDFEHWHKHGSVGGNKKAHAHAHNSQGAERQTIGHGSHKG